MSWELGVIAFGVMATMAALAAAMAALRASPRDAVVARIDRVVRRAPGTGRRDSEDSSRAAEVLQKLARPFLSLVRPTRGEELSLLRSRLVQAGLRSERAMELFLTSKLVLAVVNTLIFFQINGRLPHGLRFPMVAAAALLVCAFGFFLPNVWLNSRIKSRQLMLERALPDGMDLLVTCVEAGLSLDAALARVGEELKLAAPLLSRELNITFLETQAGVPRRDAFRHLAERTGLEDLRQLAGVLTQTEVFGTSVARALRTHSDGMRAHRMHRAERTAALAALKMTFPLVTCILPSLMAIVLGPAIVSILHNFINRPR
ncbi:MAG TPA: type II secretion system F family protein [Polyangia bacterium]|nr:type II secretion system F family protein [Polyangia bacterium]